MPNPEIETKIRRYAAKVGLGQYADILVEIAERESGLSPRAHNTKGEDSAGIFQLNRVKGGFFGPEGSPYSVEELFDPDLNISLALDRIAQGLARGGSLEGALAPWTTAPAALKQKGTTMPESKPRKTAKEIVAEIQRRIAEHLETKREPSDITEARAEYARLKAIGNQRVPTDEENERFIVVSEKIRNYEKSSGEKDPVLDALYKALGKYIEADIVGADTENAMASAVDKWRMGFEEEKLERQTAKDILDLMQKDEDQALKEWDAYLDKYTKAGDTMQRIFNEIAPFIVPGPQEMPFRGEFAQQHGLADPGAVQPSMIDLGAIQSDLFSRITPPPTRQPLDFSGLLGTPASSRSPFLSALGGEPSQVTPPSTYDSSLSTEDMMWEDLRRAELEDSSRQGRSVAEIQKRISDFLRSFTR